jgi:hypothetical protein
METCKIHECKEHGTEKVLMQPMTGAAAGLFFPNGFICVDHVPTFHERAARAAKHQRLILA